MNQFTKEKREKVQEALMALQEALTLGEHQEKLKSGETAYDFPAAIFMCSIKIPENEQERGGDFENMSMVIGCNEHLETMVEAHMENDSSVGEILKYSMRSEFTKHVLGNLFGRNKQQDEEE